MLHLQVMLQMDLLVKPVHQETTEVQVQMDLQVNQERMDNQDPMPPTVLVHLELPSQLP